MGSCILTVCIYLRLFARSSTVVPLLFGSFLLSPFLISHPMVLSAQASEWQLSEELASDELASDELASDELASDELASDELASDELVTDIAAEDRSGVRQANLQQINQQFAAAVVIPTYQMLVDKTSRLVQASRGFERSPNEETLTALNQAWLEAQLVWAKGNAFEFGPVHSLGYGMAIDAPIDTASIDWVWSRLADADNLDSDALDSVVAQPLQPSLGGLGAIAYLLDSALLVSVSDEFATNDGSLVDSSLVQRRYVSEIAKSVHTAASELLSVWQVGWNGYPAYSTVLASAGGDGNLAYLSVQSGTEEIIRGLINSLDVVVHETLPILIESAEASESAEAAVSMVDVQLVEATLKGVRLAYQSYQADSPVRLSELQTRGIYSSKSAGLSTVVATMNSDQNQQLQRSLENAIDQVVVASTQLENSAAVGSALEAAVESLTTVHMLLVDDILPIAQR